MDYLSLSRGGKFEDAKQPRIGWARYPYTGPSGYECMPTVRSDERGPFGRNRAATRAVREAVRAAGCRTPVVLSGGISTFEQAEELLRTGAADIIASARQSLADPDWFRKLRLGLGERGAALRLHQLLRGPRPGAQAGDLQALGPRRSRGRRHAADRRRPAPAGGAGLGAGRPVRVAIVGAGPAGLYLAILLKRDDPSHQVTVYERNRVEDTFGFGVVFSDETLENVGEADPETNAGDGRRRGALGGHRDPLSRHRHAVDRASLLRRRAEDAARAARAAGAIARGRDPLAAGDPRPLRLRPSRRRSDRRRRRRREPDPRPAVRPVPAPARLAPQPFRLARHHPSLPRVHLLLQAVAGRALAHPRLPVRARAARPSSSRRGRRPGRRAVSPRTTSRRRSPIWSSCSRRSCRATRSLANRSIWRRFPTVRNARWHAGNVVLLGDAAHTAHFSVGSGTKLAMEDAIALAAALKAERSIPDALAELRGRPAPAGGKSSARGAGEPRVVRIGGALPRHRAAPVRLQPAHPQPSHHAREPEGSRSGARRRGWTAGSPSRPGSRAGGRCRSIPAPRPCSRRTGSATWCCRTGSWCPRCASTGRTTGCRTTGTSCTSAAARSAAPGW